MLTRVLILAMAVAACAAADTLTLKSGRTVHGTYLGGDSRQIRMTVGDRVDTFAVADVEQIRFGDESGTAAASTAPAKTPMAQAQPAQTTAAPGLRRRDTPRDDIALTRPERTYEPARPAQTRSASTGSEVPSGSSLVVRLVDDVDSERDTVGQTFRASIDEPVIVDGQTLIPRGADAVVKLVEDKQSGKLTGRTELTLDLQSVTVNGRSIDILTSEVTQASESRTGRTAKVAGGTAALGAIIGAVAGGGRGAAIGAVTGAAAGGAVQVLTKGQRVRIPSETRLTFTLQQPLRL
ncbi:MAG TPA: hypothetical protein VFL57_17110 [Bryobacteraceae bacterium]|nr:hypothetical protein [Bryobacteraceae bacterium]